MAVDAGTGKPLWSFPTNQTWKASPMTYSSTADNIWLLPLGPASSHSRFNAEPSTRARSSDKIF